MAAVDGKQIQQGTIPTDRLEDPVDVDVCELQRDVNALVLAWVELGLPLPPCLQTRFEKAVKDR